MPTSPTTGSHPTICCSPRTLLAPPVETAYLQLLSEPVDLGLTPLNAAGRQYRHGTPTGYNTGGCKCDHCRGAYATYRAQRRAAGKDPHPPPRTTNSRTLTTDGHIPRSLYCDHIWKPALDTAGIGIRVRTHDLRHAHASWLLAGGADLRTVKERLGHASITTEKYLHTLAETDDTPLRYPNPAPANLNSKPRRRDDQDAAPRRDHRVGSAVREAGHARRDLASPPPGGASASWLPSAAATCPFPTSSSLPSCAVRPATNACITILRASNQA